ncbi:MAG: hypothetical protein J5865_08370 [Lachnospiraceae bacterium]|nr:hypothetical protein [Lachnospiraceae bacterium]
MREKLQRFMMGRYGSDQFSRFLSFAGLAMLVVYLFTGWTWLYIVAFALIILNLMRTLSRNTTRRYAENSRYLYIKHKFLSFFKKGGADGSGTRTDSDHRIFKCPGCGQKVRVPKGKGKISITCPKCKKEFIKRT